MNDIEPSMRDKDRHVEKKCFNQGVGIVDIKIQDCPLKEGNLEVGDLP